MISSEFQAVVEAGNLLRTRIMLKDAMVLDPTLEQFDQMLLYACQRLPEIIVPYDGGALEEDVSKWNQEQMNLELVQIVNNFSQSRILHLKKVVGIVFADEIQKKRMSNRGSYHQNRQGMNNDNRQDGLKNQLIARRHAIEEMSTGAERMESAMIRIRKKGGWNAIDASDVEAMDLAARRILNGTRKYKANR